MTAKQIVQFGPCGVALEDISFLTQCLQLVITKLNVKLDLKLEDQVCSVFKAGCFKIRQLVKVKTILLCYHLEILIHSFVTNHLCIVCRS